MNGKRAHRKVLEIVEHQGNAGSSYKDTPPHATQRVKSETEPSAPGSSVDAWQFRLQVNVC